jgi:galactose mutarotase-like enzyme
MIPTGEIAGVAGTPYDLRRLPDQARHRRRCGRVRRELRGARGRVAYVRDPASGRAMELWADQPGVQLYTSNWMKDEKGKAGLPRRREPPHLPVGHRQARRRLQARHALQVLTLLVAS